jgi:flagellar M-ring protein FliF
MDARSEFQTFVQRWQLPLLIVGVVAIAAAIVAGYFLWFHQSYAVLCRDLRPMDAATIVAELDKRKVPYQLSDGGKAILVPQKMVDSTRLAVMSQELPLKGVVGFELFSKSDMGLTEFAQNINYRRALQGEIARTIMALDSVESARVHLSLSEPSVFREDRRPSKASVTITPRAGRRISAQSVRGVQRLVSAAVADLEATDVVILDEDGAVISGPDPAPANAASPGLQEKTAIEAYYAGRVRIALRTRLPEDEVVVSVAVGWTRAPDSQAAVGGDVFADWSPLTRRFPLNVDVATTAPVPPQVRAQILALAGQAIGLRADAGDAITVSFASVAPPVGPEAAVGPAPATIPAQEPPAPQAWRLSAPSQFWVGLSVPVLLLLLLLAAWLHRQRVRPRRLSSRQRDVFADRLRKLLDEGDANAVAGG